MIKELIILIRDDNEAITSIRSDPIADSELILAINCLIKWLALRRKVKGIADGEFK